VKIWQPLEMVLHALWDSGFSITTMSLDAVNKLKWSIEETRKVQYQDFNKNTAWSTGTTTLALFGQKISVHVIQGLARDVIIECDIMHTWDAQISIKQKLLSCIFKPKHTIFIAKTVLTHLLVL
jgi:hypothetical protein